jgi:flagellar biosynthesis anti-sigma factor FlgM
LIDVFSTLKSSAAWSNQVPEEGSMRIDGIGAPPVHERDAKKTEPVAPTRPVEPSGSAPVVVGPKARGIAATVSKEEEAQAERVAAIRAAVNDGSYRVDLDHLAERIADDELARSGR